jgi:hypothetical protein
LGCSAGAADCRGGVNGERTFASVKRGLAYRLQTIEDWLFSKNRQRPQL